jgi:hypothetical protein
VNCAEKALDLLIHFQKRIFLPKKHFWYQKKFFTEKKRFFSEKRTFSVTKEPLLQKN